MNALSICNTTRNGSIERCSILNAYVILLDVLMNLIVCKSAGVEVFYRSALNYSACEAVTTPP